MSTTAQSNENWGKCPTCGEPVLIDPKTGETQPCATCASRKSPGVPMGAVFIAGVIVAIAVLIFVCLRILL